MLAVQKNKHTKNHTTIHLKMVNSILKLPIPQIKCVIITLNLTWEIQGTEEQEVNYTTEDAISQRQNEKLYKINDWFPEKEKKRRRKGEEGLLCCKLRDMRHINRKQCVNSIFEKLRKINHGLVSYVLKEILLILLDVDTKYDCIVEEKRSWYTIKLLRE